MKNEQTNQENNDLFEFYDQQPKELLAVTEKWGEKIAIDGLDYKDCELFLEEVQKLGYTFEYGLDAEPYGLRPLTEMELESIGNQITNSEVNDFTSAFANNDIEKGIEMLGEFNAAGKTLSESGVNQIMKSDISTENKAIALSMLNINKPENVLFPGPKDAKYDHTSSKTELSQRTVNRDKGKTL